MATDMSTLPGSPVNCTGRHSKYKGMDAGRFRQQHPTTPTKVAVVQPEHKGETHARTRRTRRTHLTHPHPSNKAAHTWVTHKYRDIGGGFD